MSSHLLKVFRTASQSYISRILTVTTIRNRNDGIIIDRDDDPSIMIPPYIEKVGESLKIMKARLTYQSRKRGMLENGLLLSTFAAKYLKSMNEEQTKQYDKLINQPTNDWEIYYWATEVKDTPKEYDNEVMKMLKAHVKNFSQEIKQGLPPL